MNRKQLIRLTLPVALLGVTLYWFWPRDKEPCQTPDASGDPPTGAGGGGLPWTQRLPDLRDLPRPDDVSEEDWKTFLRNRAIAEASNQRVLFYGKVVDQNGDPVVGAELRATVVSRTGVGTALVTGEDQSKKALDAVTDESGRFMLDGGTGFGLLLDKIEKPGYVLKPYTKSQFMYGQLLRDPTSSRFHHPDRAKPVVFRMWKLGKLEPLHVWRAVSIYAGRKGRMQDHFFSLETMKATTEEPPVWDVFVDGERREDGSWWAQMSVFEGGLQIVDEDGFLFEAPQEGYESKLRFEGESDRDVKGPFSVYLTSRGGSIHASFLMKLSPWTAGGVHFDLKDVRVNPHGSRNLQFDGTNKIPPGFR